MPDPEPAIDPSELSGYLASRGWRREGSWRGAGVWELETSGRLLIPDHREFEDDSELLAEAVRKLAGYEERPERELLLDIAEPMVDSQYFRTHPETPSGTIPLPSGVKALNGVHLLMSTAARTVEEGPRMFFEGRRSGPVENFLQRVMLGAARPGSYVLTARVPVAAPEQPQLSLWGGNGQADRAAGGRPPRIPGRAVLSGLYRAVGAARTAAGQVIERRAAEGQERLDVFDDSVEQGVSANLCRALGDLGGSARDRPFEIGFAWARGLPAQEPNEPVAFSGPMASVLSRAADELERLAKSGHAQITGEVETLNMRAGEEPRIKVVGEFRSGTREPYRRALWVIVSRGQYDQAIEAQRAGWWIDAEGRMVTVHRRRELRPERFDVRRQ
jgi:hypothetical protein